MFMTVLKADTKSMLRAKRPLHVDDSYRVHQWLTQQQDSPRVADNLLYHVEVETYSTTMYIQSETMFNMEGVEDIGFKVVQANIPVCQNHAVGDKIFFQVRVLPQKCKQGRRVQITNPAERREWFVQKCANAGLDIIACEEHNAEPICFVKNKKRVREIACVYAGVAIVKDVDVLNDMLLHGFGRGKAFGAGLFMTA